MRILVTGNRGYVGRHVCAKLKQLGHEIVPSNTEQNNVAKGLCPGQIGPVGAIFHLAALAKAGDYCLTHQGEQWLENQKINTNILDYWVNEAPHASFVTMGTSCGYDPELVLKTEELYLHGQPDYSLFFYAMTKRMLLIGLEGIQEQYGLKHSYYIPNTMYGPNFDLTDTHFIFDLIKKIVDAKYTGSTATLWGNGYQRRELVYIDDVTQILADNIGNDVGRQNIAPGVEYSIREYAHMICHYVGYEFDEIQFDTNAFTGVLSKKIENTFKHKHTNISEGLAATIDYYIKEKKYEV